MAVKPERLEQEYENPTSPCCQPLANDRARQIDGCTETMTGTHHAEKTGDAGHQTSTSTS